MIASFVNQKGGVGKSTLAIHVAVALALRGQRVLMIDADSQGSVLDWATARSRGPDISVVAMANASIHRKIKRWVRKYDHVVIDSPPHEPRIIRSAVLASDVVVIPVQASPLDVWSSFDTVRWIDSADHRVRARKAVFIVNRNVPEAPIAQALWQSLRQFKYPALNSVISQRFEFAESMANGSIVLEQYASSEASGEIEKLTDELLRVVYG